MVTKFKIFESHKDVDPYGEEDWDDNEFQIGDLVTCIEPDSAGRLEKGKDYRIHMFYFNEKRYFSVERSGTFWQSNRFIKKKLNESHEDIDPYGEEEWDDNEFQIGDTVLCIRDLHFSDLKSGNYYKVFDISDRINCIKINYRDYWLPKTWFKKVKINESHEDIDPFGEEEWDDDDKEFKIGDKIICIRTNFANGITLNKIYQIIKFDYNKDPYIINDYGYNAIYKKNRFKKVKLNESHEDIDPYGEEEWDEFTTDLKVGDRVICDGSVSTYSKDILGKSGKIIEIEHNDYNFNTIITVEFDHYIDGHSGNHGKDGHCWNFADDNPTCSIKNLKKI